LSLSLLGESSLLQIHPNGIRHIREDKRIHEWRTPGKKTIVQSAVNSRQVVIGLTGGELVYFELDPTGNLMDVHRKEMRNDIACLAIGPIPEGRQRSTFMVVGSFDNTVRVLSLDPTQPMHQLTMQALPAQPQSLCLVNMSGSSTDGLMSLHLFVGLQNGVMMRSVVDETDGRLSDSRKRFLGTRPVKLFEVQVYGTPAVLALSTRSWLSYSFQGRFEMTPLSYEVLEHCSAFTSEQCPEGVVCISENTLRIVTLEKLGELFNQTVVPLRYTPRKLLIHEESSNLVLLETDHNSYSYKVKKELQATLAMDDEDDDDEEKAKKEEGDDSDDEEKQDGPSEAFIGSPQAGVSKWASCIRIVDPVQGETLSLLELEDNEAAFSACMVQFKTSSDANAPLTDMMLAVGTAKDYQLNPPKCGAGFIRMYRFVEEDEQLTLELVHKTPVTEAPLAMAAHANKLLVGLGKFLRVYDLGKRKMLRKCENKNFPTCVKSLLTMGDRIYAGDMCENFFLVKYNAAEKTLDVLADCINPRFLTSSCLVDFDTIASGDKFGNIAVARLPPGVQEDIERDPTGGNMKLIDRVVDQMAGAPHKIHEIVQYHVGEIVTSIKKVPLVTGGAEVLLYSTIMGGIGIFVPFLTKDDVAFFSHLEMHLRQENPPLCGRDHLAFRSYYFPVRGCVDGDLCEQFNALPYERQQAIAEELVMVPAEVSKKLEEIRNRVL